MSEQEKFAYTQELGPRLSDALERRDGIRRRAADLTEAAEAIAKTARELLGATEGTWDGTWNELDEIYGDLEEAERTLKIARLGMKRLGEES